MLCRCSASYGEPFVWEESQRIGSRSAFARRRRYSCLISFRFELEGVSLFLKDLTTRLEMATCAIGCLGAEVSTWFEAASLLNLCVPVVFFFLETL